MKFLDSGGVLAPRKHDYFRNLVKSSWRWDIWYGYIFQCTKVRFTATVYIVLYCVIQLITCHTSINKLMNHKDFSNNTTSFYVMKRVVVMAWMVPEFFKVMGTHLEWLVMRLNQSVSQRKLRQKICSHGTKGILRKVRWRTAQALLKWYKHGHAGQWYSYSVRSIRT